MGPVFSGRTLLRVSISPRHYSTPFSFYETSDGCQGKNVGEPAWLMVWCAKAAVPEECIEAVGLINAERDS